MSDRVASPWLASRGGWLRDPEGKAYPAPLWDAIREEIVEPEEVTAEAIRAFLDPDRAASLLPAPVAEELLGGLRVMIAVSRTHTSLYGRLATPAEVLHAVYYPGIDRVSHLFMQYRKPLLPWVDATESEALGGVVDRFYEFQDSLLPALLERAGEDTTVILCSDHGFRTGLDRPRTDPRIGHGPAADWHRKSGVLVLRGPAIRAGHRIDPASVLDIVPTVLTVLGLPVPADLEGRVLVESFRPEFLLDHSVRYRSPVAAGGAAGSSEPLASGADEAIRSELRSLGYLSQDTHSGHNNLGILHLERGQVDDAIREFRLALQDRPGLPILRINLGRAYLAKGDRQKARSILRGVVVEQPAAKEAWLLLASLAREEGPEVAEEYLVRAVALDPNDPESRLALGSLFEETGRWEAAAEQYHRLMEIDPDSPDGPNRIGILYRRRGDAARAREMFEQALEVDPAFAGAWNNLGLILQDLGDLGGAEAALRAGLQRNPSHAVLRTSLGSLYFRVHRLDEARRELLAALRIDPRHVQAHNNLAAVLDAIGDRKGRIEHLLRALEIQEGFPDARYNLAIAYLETGREGEGIQELEKTLQFDPSHLSALLRLARERTRRGEAAEAEDLLRRAREAHPGRPEPLNLLARIRLGAGRREEARRFWEDSLRLDPDQPEVRREMETLSAEPAGGLP
ncbi:MAG: tetratricopeptide repeat protein [Acidobacteria bacterium]|nr:tetratricopeptide repeat protein [Acidobacteriota bacterium]